MQITYHIAEHDGGWAYRLGDVWSEPFASHDEALAAARRAAERQQVGGDNAEIDYQSGDGRWRHEHVDGGDRPEVEVDTKD